MKPRRIPGPNRPILAVPMAALMLGAAEAGTTVGINFSGDYAGYFAGVPVTATAFGIAAADWQSTPIAWGSPPFYGYDYAATSGAIVFAGLGINWNCTNTWTSQWGLPTESGDAEVTHGFLDNTGWSAGVDNINTTFPGGCVLGLIAVPGKVTLSSSVSLTENAGSTSLGSITFQISDGVGIGASPLITHNAITLTNPDRESNPANCALGGLIATDKPVIIKQPVGSVVATGNSISLSAVTIGIPPMTYQWYQGATALGSPVTETTNTSINATYTKTGATPADSGNYTLVVTNAHGSGTSVAAAVNVAIPATVAWDADTGTSGAQGGSGTWDLSTANWWDGAADIAWSDPNFATFGAGSGASSVTLASNITTSGMTVDGDYTFSTGSGSTLTFLTPSTVATTGNTTLSLPIAGTGPLTKTGPGTLSIVSRGNFSGPITVQEGTLAFPVTGDIPGYWYQWLLNTSVINLMPSTTLNCPGNAFGWYGNNNATGVTINIGRNAVCQPNGAFGIAYNLTGGRIGTGTSRLDIGSSGGFTSYISSHASDVTSVVDPEGGIMLRIDSGQSSCTFTTALGTTASGIDLNIAAPINQNGTGSIVKAGAGALELSAVNTYSGTTTVNEGSLVVTGRINNNGKIWFKDNTSLKVTGAGSVPAVLTAGDLNVGTDFENPAGMNTLTFHGVSSTSIAPVTAGNLFLDSPVTVNITTVTPTVGHYPLMKITGTNSAVYNMTLGTLPAGITATLVDDLAGPSKSIYLDVTDVAVPTSVWEGSVNGTWDVATTANWAGASVYTDGNIAEFDDTGANTDITLNEIVNPAEVGFYNSTVNYSISGTGAIAGTTQLFKAGTGTLTLNNNHTYTGKTTVSGGTLKLSGTLATPEIANSAALVYDINSPQTITYALTGTGSLTKSGSATLTLQGNKNFSGGVTVDQGTLHIDAGGWYVNPFGQPNTVTINTGGTLTTAGAHSLGVDNNSIVINGGSLILGAENYISGLTMNGGTVSGGELRTWGGTMTFGESAGGSLISSPFSLVGGPTLNVSDGTAVDDLTISGVISNSNGLIKTGAGTLRMTATNTYSGDTTVSGGTLAVNGNSIKDTNKLVLNGGKVDVTGNETVDKLFFGATQQAAGTYGATGSGASVIDDTRFSGTGVVTVVTGPPGFSAWAATNAPGQTIDMDHDNDGVSNGIEYFMGLSGSSFTANPAPIGNVVSWPKGATYTGVYGIDYVVQTSTDLSNWTNVPEGELTSNGNPVQYTLPTTGPVLFVRLKVTGP